MYCYENRMSNEVSCVCDHRCRWKRKPNSVQFGVCKIFKVNISRLWFCKLTELLSSDRRWGEQKMRLMKTKEGFKIQSIFFLKLHFFYVSIIFFPSPEKLTHQDLIGVWNILWFIYKIRCGVRSGTFQRPHNILHTIRFARTHIIHNHTRLHLIRLPLLAGRCRQRLQ